MKRLFPKRFTWVLVVMLVGALVAILWPGTLIGSLGLAASAAIVAAREGRLHDAASPKQWQAVEPTAGGQ